MVVVLSGCGEQGQDAGGEAPVALDQGEAQPGVDAADGEPLDETATDDTADAADGDVTKLADVIEQWPSSFIMTQKITEKDTDTTMTVRSAMKMGDEKLLKMKAEIENAKVLFDYEDNMRYMWDMASGTAVKGSLSEGPAEQQNPYADVDPDAEITGSETIDGVECWVVETSDTEGGTVTSWVSKENGLMQRVEGPATVTEFEYEQIGSVPDSEFALPEDVEFQEMPAVPDMGDMPQMPDMPEGVPGQ
jgi:hypothetical protein